MTDVVLLSGRSNGAAADVLRAALSLALDGVEPPSQVVTLEAYRLARLLTEACWSHVLQALAAAPDGALCVIGDGSDGIGQLLRATGVRFTHHASWNSEVEGAAIACLGCPRASANFDDQRLLDFMWNGGLLITSDHAASLPALRGLLQLAGRGAPRRARARRLSVGTDALLPVVFMPAGYDRMAPLPDDGHVRALAIDALTDEPLVVLAPVGAGALLHAAPHWFQDGPANLTDLERRPAHCAPAYAGLELTHPDVTVGDIQAAETLFGLLLEGIEAALGLREASANPRASSAETAEDA